MASEAATFLAPKSGARTKAKRGGSPFFYGMSLLLLAIVLVGFAPTFYLRAIFPTPSIPPYLYVHGIVLTAWFIWLPLQTSLVRSGRLAQHRAMGVAGATIAAGVVLVGPMAAMGLVPRALSAGLHWTTDMSMVLGPPMAGVKMIDFFTRLVTINLISITAFALLVGAAIVLRRKSAWHKRLILLGSLAIITPALGRISRLPHLGGENGPFSLIVLFALLLALIGHDVLTRRKLHPATIAGVGVIAAGVVAQQLIAASDWGHAFVRALG
jgi:hypothetical protein